MIINDLLLNLSLLHTKNYHKRIIYYHRHEPHLARLTLRYTRFTLSFELRRAAFTVRNVRRINQAVPVQPRPILPCLILPCPILPCLILPHEVLPKRDRCPLMTDFRLNILFLLFLL